MRLFVAIEVPEPHKRSIEKALQKLRTALPEVRWIPRNNWHATLKFLGEVPEQRLAAVESTVSACLESFQPTRSHLTVMGAFPSTKRARVLWVGLSDDAGSLSGLATSLDQALGALGFRQESRPLRPHITVARMKVALPVAEMLDQNHDFDQSPFPISEAILYRSRLNRMGAEYQALSSFPAKGIPPSP